MSKKIVSFEKEVGGDGAKVAAELAVEGEFLVAAAAVKYPIAKVIEPATKAVDSLLDKLEAAIPGDWDKPMIEKFKEEYKADLVKLLAEQPAA